MEAIFEVVRTRKCRLTYIHWFSRLSATMADTPSSFLVFVIHRFAFWPLRLSALFVFLRSCTFQWFCDLLVPIGDTILDWLANFTITWSRTSLPPGHFVFQPLLADTAVMFFDFFLCPWAPFCHGPMHAPLSLLLIHGSSRSWMWSFLDVNPSGRSHGTLHTGRYLVLSFFLILQS
jgi:hypothetical protein